MFPDQPKVVKSYAELMFMDFGHEFTSEKLSRLMVAATKPVVGWGVNVSSWCHINIALKRKLCQVSTDIADQTAASTVYAMLNGHSPGTENRVYGLSPDATMGASEDVFHLYLDASTDWQKAFKIVPGGLGLAYTQVRSNMFDNLVKQDVIKIKNKPRALQDSVHQPVDNFTSNMLRDFQTSTAKTDALILERQEETLTQLKLLTSQVKQIQQELAELHQGSLRPTEVDPFDLPLEYVDNEDESCMSLL